MMDARAELELQSLRYNMKQLRKLLGLVDGQSVYDSVARLLQAKRRGWDAASGLKDTIKDLTSENVKLKAELAKFQITNERDAQLRHVDHLDYFPITKNVPPMHCEAIGCSGALGGTWEHQDYRNWLFHSPATLTAHQDRPKPAVMCDECYRHTVALDRG